MKIQINTDSIIDGREEVAANIKGSVGAAMDHFSRQITRIEVHLSDQNAGKGGSEDKRCVMEARIEGREPVAASHEAGSVVAAVDGATRKLKRSIQSTLDRLNDARRK